MMESRRTNRLGWIVVLIAVVFVGQSALDAWQYQEATQDRRRAFYCLLEYNVEASRADQLHQNRTVQDRLAITRVIKALEAGDQQLLDRRLRQYVNGAEQRNRAAEANPPPNPNDYPCLEE